MGGCKAEGCSRVLLLTEFDGLVPWAVFEPSYAEREWAETNTIDWHIRVLGLQSNALI